MRSSVDGTSEANGDDVMMRMERIGDSVFLTVLRRGEGRGVEGVDRVEVHGVVRVEES